MLPDMATASLSPAMRRRAFGISTPNIQTKCIDCVPQLNAPTQGPVCRLVLSKTTICKTRTQQLPKGELLRASPRWLCRSVAWHFFHAWKTNFEHDKDGGSKSMSVPLSFPKPLNLGERLLLRSLPFFSHSWSRKFFS